jgi:hypothetical protein
MPTVIPMSFLSYLHGSELNMLGLGITYGEAGATLYVKESCTGNIRWVAK